MVYTVGIGKNLLHQRHAAAKAVTGKYNHIHLDEDLIFNLHWLDVKKGIVFSTITATGKAKSHLKYAGIYSSVSEYTIGIIVSGMTYYHHLFEEYIE